MDDRYRAPVTDGDRNRAGLAIQLVAAATGVTADRMRGQVRLGGAECRARWLAMYLSYVTYGWPLERVGHAFGLNRATASVACRWVEDARDDTAVDTLLDRLEVILRDICAAPRLELAA